MIQGILLGNAQDAGLPQAGCGCANCTAAWADPARRRLASALALLDEAAGAWWLVDATPDIREQLHQMQTRAPAARLGGVLITHVHMGHYAGLLHLGFEAMAVRGLPLYGTPRLLDFLRANGPWRQLVEQGHLDPRPLAPGEWLNLTPTLSVQPLLVPHRAEWSDTVAFVARGPRRQLLYLPDIDSWAAWAEPPFGRDVRQVAAGVDVALLDGTFYSADELPGRDLSRIPHPFIADTAARLAGLATEVVFIHLNHSNPLHREARGVRVGQEGEMWEL